MEPVNTMQTTFEVISFIASIASLILAVGAIWLSIVFFRMSNDAAKDTTAAAKEIQSSVERLENLFDKLYTDTFSMMKETVTDMRHHIWKKPITGSTDDDSNQEAKLDELKNNIKSELIAIMDEKISKDGLNGASDEKIKELEESINKVLDSQFKKPMRETLNERRRLIMLIKREGITTLRRLKDIWNMRYEGEFPINALFSLRDREQITWDGNPERLSYTSKIRWIAPETDES
ncbi:TPA: hypothetical protein U2J54_003816 [Providencia rettgeri]|nr:hypothetical protein [Providencia rettgeri]HEM8269028.1 hypothetical protein [Providencia rettgeri]